MNIGKKECTFLWRIENYSFCWHEIGDELVSPEFTANGFEGTVWTLGLYPRRYVEESEGYITLYLNRCEDDDGPEDFSVEYQLSILAEKGLSVHYENEDSFKKGYGFGQREFLERHEALQLRKDDFLPHDTLSVQCEMWRGEGSVRERTEITARTRIGIEQISFLHLTDNFSKLVPNERKTIEIGCPSKKKWTLTSNLYFIEDSSGGKLILKITPSDKNHILTTCKISLLDRCGRKIECGEADNRPYFIRKDIQILSLSIPRQVILSKRSSYLKEDNLSLSCECVFSTGVEFVEIERCLHERLLKVYYEICNQAQPKEISKAAKNLSAYPNALDDLKAVYNDKLLSDVELKTKTKSFPAHKICLCARSPVFRNMLSSDMKEKNSGIIHIDDLEDETVQQFLLFLYTDELEDLRWDSATKLYYAGDKYEITKLKAICSSFLVENISATSASDLLILADRHSDSDLRGFVEDFILKHDEEVFASKEWEKLSEVNLKLAHKTMLLKYKRK